MSSPFWFASRSRSFSLLTCSSTSSLISSSAAYKSLTNSVLSKSSSLQNSFSGRLENVAFMKRSLATKSSHSFLNKSRIQNQQPNFSNKNYSSSVLTSLFQNSSSNSNSTAYNWFKNNSTFSLLVPSSPSSFNDFNSSYLYTNRYFSTDAEEPKVVPLSELEKKEKVRKPRRVGKSKRLRQPNEAWAVIKNIRVSHKKMEMAIKPIRGLSYMEAARQLAFSSKRIARTVVLRALQSCRYNAENVHRLNPERCVVSEIWTGRHAILKRRRYRGKGGMGIMFHRYTRLTIILKETPYVKGEKKLGKHGRNHPRGYDERMSKLFEQDQPTPEESQDPKVPVEEYLSASQE